MRGRDPGRRKAALWLHVVASVGWLGAVTTYLALAVLAFRAEDVVRAGALYDVMQTLVWLVLLPLAVASLGSGLLSSWVSPWGLFRHYWVLLKFGLNLLCTFVLALYTQDVRAAADATAAAAAGGRMPLTDPSHVVHSTAALVVLVLATALAVYKPTGRLPVRATRRAAAAVR
jgi:hypothetical protein